MSKLLACLLTGALVLQTGLAQASSMSLPEEPMAYVNTPPAQAGVAAESFSFDVELFHFPAHARGSISFVVNSASHDDGDGVSIAPVTFEVSGSPTRVRVRPVFRKAGIYLLKVNVQTQGIERSYDLQLLQLGAAHYYAWQGADIYGVIAAQRLQANARYQQLQRKAEGLRSARYRAAASDALWQEPAYRFLSEPEQQEYQAIKHAERTRVVQLVRAQLGLR